MPFAVVTRVNLEGRDQEKDRQRLKDEGIPHLKSLPGFQGARFLRSTDGKTGVGVIIFDSEVNAKEALAARPPDAAPFESEEICEVAIEV
jgi:heme-degrading monooxygenase HmoA